MLKLASWLGHNFVYVVSNLAHGPLIEYENVHFGIFEINKKTTRMLYITRWLNETLNVDNVRKTVLLCEFSNFKY